MLELSRRLAVAGAGGPAVALVDFNAVGADVEHGLDGEQHPGYELHALTQLAEVEDVRRHVELLAQTVADELPDDGKARLLPVLLDRSADIAQRRPRPDGVDAVPHGLIGHPHQLFPGRVRGAADDVHARGITVPAVDDDGNVDVQNVLVDQLFVV